MSFGSDVLAIVGILMGANGCHTGPQHAPYSLLFNAEPGNQDLYKDLVPVGAGDERVRDVVRYARETAHAAGYPLSGDSLDVYTFNGSPYAVRTSVSGNVGYYMVVLIPEDLPEESHNLQISIRKRGRKVIAILEGG